MELDWPVTSMKDVVSGPGSGLGLAISPPTPALSPEPGENQQETDEEPGTVSVSLTHQSLKRQCRASGTAELEDVASCVLAQKSLQEWSTSYPTRTWT